FNGEHGGYGEYVGEPVHEPNAEVGSRCERSRWGHRTWDGHDDAYLDGSVCGSNTQRLGREFQGGHEWARRLHAGRFTFEPDSDARRVDELQRDHQSDGWLQRPGQPERRRTTERNGRELSSDHGTSILYAVGDDGHGHARPDFHPHHHPHQPPPFPYTTLFRSHEWARRLHAGRFTFEPDSDARRVDELQRDHQSDGWLQRPGQPERRRT